MTTMTTTKETTAPPGRRAATYESGNVDEHRYVTIPDPEKSTRVDPISQVLRLPDTVPVTDYQNLAKEVGAERTRLHDLDGRHPSQDRGSDNNEAGDYDGALCELAFIRYAQKNGLRPKYILLASYAVKGADLVIDRVCYDCKCARVHKGQVNINCEGHSERRASFYLIGTLLDSLYGGPEQIILWPPIRHSEVSTWEIDYTKHSPFYWCTIDYLIERLGV